MYIITQLQISGKRKIGASNQTLRNFAGSEKAFIKSSYKGATGKSNPMYLMNRDGFMFVVMGFNAMEQILLNFIMKKSADFSLVGRSTAMLVLVHAMPFCV